jgi:hypothetical protein
MAAPEWKARMTAILDQELSEQASPLLLDRLHRQIDEAGDQTELPKRLATIRTALRLFVGARVAEQVMSRLNAAAPRA